MLFTSYLFLLFLTVLFLVYFTVPKKVQWMVLLAASYIFYAFAGLGCLVFIAATTLTSYLVARLMAANRTHEEQEIVTRAGEWEKEKKKAYRAAEKKKRFRILLAGLIFNFGILAVLKYTGFTVVNLNAIIHAFGGKELSVPSLLLPMGISFYTFQTMGYLIDVYRGKCEAEKNPARLALFVSFFPQLVQGPISRYHDLAHQLYAEHAFEHRSFTYGIQRVLWGYFKKLVIADRILIAMKVLLSDSERFNGVYVLLLILLYSAEIYADFTGGIDITIGIAEALGIRVTENFNHPFASTSTKEYWRRWHITMGSWFTDYVFYPLSVCRPMMKLSKFSRKTFGNAIGKRIPVYLSTVVTWFLTGLWHGAAWNFIVWGLLNCLIILVSQELEPLYKKFHTKFPTLHASRGYLAFGRARTFLLMGLIRSLDCYRNVGMTFRMWGSMFSVFNWNSLGAGFSALGLGAADWCILGGGILLMWGIGRLSEKESVRERLYPHPVLSWCLCGLLFLSVIMLGIYGVGYDASQFIYDQF